MDFEHGTDKSTEAQESRINIYNVVLSYVIEMNEHRAEIYSASQGQAGVTPMKFQDFIRTFYKLFKFTKSMLPDNLKKEIDLYFSTNPKATDYPKGINGIALSEKMQKELENQRMITLYEETIVPPFVEILEEEHPLAAPKPPIKKPNQNAPKKQSKFLPARRG